MDDDEQGGDTGPCYGPIIDIWDRALEKLKILNYESTYCTKGRRPFHRVHFVYAGSNSGVQFDEFATLCEWLCKQIKGGDVFERDQYDDPNTVVNKLLLALRSLGYECKFSPQKLKAAHGEPVVDVIDFLCSAALTGKNFTWGNPIYPNDAGDDEGMGGDDEEEEEEEGEGEIADEVGHGGYNQGGEEEYYGVEDGGVSGGGKDTSMDSHHGILQGTVDPVEWKTEVERVTPKLRMASAGISTNEWRAHVDQTATSKGAIEKILATTEGDLQLLNRQVSEELQRALTKEKYVNHQFAHLSSSFSEHKKELEKLEKVGEESNERVAKMSNELADISERVDELKENFDSKDNNIHDQSPLVRMKSALQHLKSEMFSFDLRIGVVSHSLLTARIKVSNRKRAQAQHKTKSRKHKHGAKNKYNRHQSDSQGYISD